MNELNPLNNVIIYPAALTINSLSLMVNLGYGEGERQEKQQIKLDVELYFSNPPLACRHDGKGFICYDGLATVLKNVVKGRDFALIEYLSAEMTSAMEDFLQTAKVKAEIEDVRYVLKLHKCFAPVEDLLGGTTYIYSNLLNGLK